MTVGLEAAHTIDLCAKHQNRIISDILTVGKLDASLLTLSPEPIRPLEIVAEVIKMYESELSMADIEGKIEVHESFQQVGIYEVSSTPSMEREHY